MSEQQDIFVVTTLMSGKIAFYNKLDAESFIDGLPYRERRITELDEVILFTSPVTAAQFVNIKRKDPVILTDDINTIPVSESVC